MAEVSKRLTKREFENLDKSVVWSIKQLTTPRQNRVDAIKQFLGNHYSDYGSDETMPVNLLKLAHQIYVRSLAARAPRALIGTRNPQLKATAANLELAVNDIPAEIDLENTLRRWVGEALFSMGILRVGLVAVSEVMGIPYGQPFVEVVTSDDYFLDMSAKNHAQVQYEGHDYLLTHEELRDLGWVSKQELKELDDGAETTIGPNGQERAEGISAGGGGVESFKRRLLVRDVWLPKERRLVTYAVKAKKLLNDIEWEGPQHSPYYVLGFSDVPGNLLPLSPVSVWRDLHELANALFRKLACQADDQKRVLGFQGGNDDSVMNFKRAKDGEGIKYTGSEPKVLAAGGIDPQTLAYFMQCRDLASYFGGNLDALGGLAPQTETLGQDRLLSEAASAQLRDMQTVTISQVREVFRALAWYEWHDPVGERLLEKPLPGMPGQSIPVLWNRNSRQGDFDEYQLDIDVFSLLDNSPTLKLQRLGYIMSTYIIPLMPEIQRQGGELDVQSLLKLVAKLTDFDELQDIIVFANEPQPPTGQQAAGQPAETKRTYEHTSRPAPTSQADEMMSQLLEMGQEA